MKSYFSYLFSISFFLLSSCASTSLLPFDVLLQDNSYENTKYIINDYYDLGGRNIVLPANCTLLFKKVGSINNGSIIGNNTKIQYSKPFLGESVSLSGCYIVGKKVVRDKDVFITVSHTQKEIQTLFDICGGIRLVFSKGIYHNIEKIRVNNSIKADFNNSIIELYYDRNYVGECFYMEPWEDKEIEYFYLSNLQIKGKRYGISGMSKSRRCIQLFNISDVKLDNVFFNEFEGGLYEHNAGDLLTKSRIGTCAIAIINYDKCTINNCKAYDVGKEIFWCVPNNNPHNITYFTNNTSDCSLENGSDSFFTLLDGRCYVKNNEVRNYNGSAFNVFCYDSEICNNKFYDGKRSIAIDLSEGTMYRASNVYIHDNECINTKGLFSAFGENIKVERNSWVNNKYQTEEDLALIYIYTRARRNKEGDYIGCENNPEYNVGTKGIVITNNTFVNNSDNSIVINGALIYGDSIWYSKNTMIGLHTPVVQLIRGNDFSYINNVIDKSKQIGHSELLIDRGRNVVIRDNRFFQNYSSNDIDCTVKVVVAQGALLYEKNSIKTDCAKDRIYYPCYILNYSELEKAEILVDTNRRDIKMKTGLLNSKDIKIVTNIQ